MNLSLPLTMCFCPPVISLSSPLVHWLQSLALTSSPCPCSVTALDGCHREVGLQYLSLQLIASLSFLWRSDRSGSSARTKYGSTKRQIDKLSEKTYTLYIALYCWGCLPLWLHSLQSKATFICACVQQLLMYKLPFLLLIFRCCFCRNPGGFFFYLLPV